MPETTPTLFMVFDVESVGLHGEGFAVGWVVVTATGAEVTHGLLWTDPLGAQGSAAGQAWVAAHCGPFDRPPCANTAEVRSRFWEIWRVWQAAGGGIGGRL